ncbi:MAG: hypothetical protein AAGA48_22570 [Myxococcota bacterium]
MHFAAFAHEPRHSDYTGEPTATWTVRGGPAIGETFVVDEQMRWIYRVVGREHAVQTRNPGDQLEEALQAVWEAGYLAAVADPANGGPPDASD